MSAPLRSFGSLCSGLGGADLGLRALGLTLGWQVERDPHRRAVLARRFPGVPCPDDVRDPAAFAGLPRVDLIHAEPQRAETEYVAPVAAWICSARPTAAILNVAGGHGTAIYLSLLETLVAAGYQVSATNVRHATVLRLGDGRGLASIGRSIFFAFVARETVPVLPEVVELTLGAYSWLAPSRASGYLEPAAIDMVVDERAVDAPTLEAVRGLPRDWSCACGATPCTCDPVVRHLAVREATAPSLLAWAGQTLLDAGRPAVEAGA